MMTQVYDDKYLVKQIRNNGVVKNVSLHRLVAKVFIPNPEGKPEVNHLDEWKSNNCMSNLVWATAEENMNYSATNVWEVTKDGVRLKEYESATKASEATGCNLIGILQVCKGDRSIVNGKYFSY